MADCIFCDIIAGASPAREVYSDDHVVGFLDIRPVMRGHTLIVPRMHSSGLTDLEPEIGARIFTAGQRVGVAVRTALGADGVNLLVNDGRAAMQTVFHTHLHVVPRHDGDKLSFAKGLVIRRDPNPDDTADRIRRALAY